MERDRESGRKIEKERKRERERQGGGREGVRETKRKGERGEGERKREIRVDGERKREVRGWGGDRDAHVYLFFLLCNITMHDNNIIIQTKYSSVAMCVFVVLPSYWLFFLSCLVLSFSLFHKGSAV